MTTSTSTPAAAITAGPPASSPPVSGAPASGAPASNPPASLPPTSNPWVHLRQTDFPSVRDSYDATVGQLVPADGYQGCIALLPTEEDSATLEVVLYVDKALAPDGITWIPAYDGAVVIDVPTGFNIGNGDAIQSWIARSRARNAGTSVPTPALGHP
jgi:hypothetical protein